MKRIIDVIFVMLALTLLLPVLIIIAVLVRVKLGSPIFFVQQRPGKDGNIFPMIKFRTMLNSVHKNGDALPDEQRMTPLGGLLRSTSLDELPGLFNVLTGNMSLVGPRPLLVEYLPLYSQRQARRHEVRPGITGWAQINGRNTVSWEEKFELDVWYVENQSLWLDMKILLLTVKKVFQREGISADGEVTMPRFAGTQHNSGTE